ncbi:MAG: bifunctional 3-deoxy-7-phosphoheptulonate synthase/chorismate mutase type II [Bacteroidales bacterium]|nr:bifunctional 3-deoxy-7-phosphoheptulonate synthase/chorismate mutase type II [Bacteroidales bacterium]
MKKFLSASTKPIIICGPCSAESREQVLKSAEEVKESGIEWFRAGLWKPRTRPHSFEGVGEEGISWLNEVQKMYSLKVCTEVANPYHVELCLKNNIDALWIGARSAANPFTVQEIAESLRGVKDISVMVKNPTTPDVNLWLGDIERIEKQGINDIIAVHRGFNLQNNLPYRQSPLWRIPLELKQRRKDLKIICDASHIAGKSELVKEIAKCSASIGFNGLMIEAHSNPKKAKTDAQQQLYTKELKSFLNEINFPLQNKGQEDCNLQMYREEINDIDENICILMAERMNLSKKIAQIKIEKNMTVFQADRWKEVMNRTLERGEQAGLSKDFLQEIYNIIHQESVRLQENIINSKNGK